MSHADRIESEEGIIRELAPLAAALPGAFGLADDCAVIAPEPGCELVVKTDPIIAGVHFLPDDPPGDIAWKALAVNVSDLVAKGASPIAYLMALALPEAPLKSWLTEFASGLAAAQHRFGCALAGGDTDRTPGPLTVAITAFGAVPAGRMVRRGTARAGDILFVSGSVGDARLGLELRRAGQVSGAALDEAERAILLDRYRRPQPRLELIASLRAHASAAMDISDGLLKDLDRMCRASGVGARIEAVRVPLSAPARRVVAEDGTWLPKLLSAGDDYEVLTAVPAERAQAFARAAGEAGVAVTEIGQVVGGDARVEAIAADGTPLALERSGWDHFSSPRGD